jgi:hypothetical protein
VIVTGTAEGVFAVRLTLTPINISGGPGEKSSAAPTPKTLDATLTPADK